MVKQCGNSQAFATHSHTLFINRVLPSWNNESTYRIIEVIIRELLRWKLRKCSEVERGWGRRIIGNDLK
jgi:hypothetical protein